MRTMKTCPSIPSLMMLAFGIVAAVMIIAPGAGAAGTGILRIVQGQTVYVGEIIDISGVLPPYSQLAYWDGMNMYDSAPTYVINLPVANEGWYNFYVDPAIFSNRPGAWYKYDSTIGYEPKGNNLAFVVATLNTPAVTSTIPATTITTAATPPPTLSTPATPVPTRTPVSAPTPGIVEKGDNAVLISLIIVGLVFGFFTLIESDFWSRK